jgi:hypothetical protein
MSNKQVAPETNGVTVKLLATVDLGPRRLATTLDLKSPVEFLASTNSIAYFKLFRRM